MLAARLVRANMDFRTLWSQTQLFLLNFAKFTALSFIEPELLPIEVLHFRNREFRVFLRKIVENIKISHLYRRIDADNAETYFLTHYRLF